MNVLNFIFSNLNAIVLVFWFLFLFVVTIRFFRPSYVKNISFIKLSFLAFFFNIFYALFVTWGQYYVWINGSELTKGLLKLPLPREAPLPFEFLRRFFENDFGYFAYYVLGRVYFDLFILFAVSFLLYLLFKFWKFYRGGFSQEGPEMLLTLMLISGYPGVFILIPVAFLFSILYFLFFYIKMIYRKTFVDSFVLEVESSFLFATFFVLLFTRIILNMLQ